MTPHSTLTAELVGGAGDGRTVDLPLEEFPETLDYVTSTGTVPYARVGRTAAYRPATVLGALEAPTRQKAKKAAPAAPPAPAAPAAPAPNNGTPTGKPAQPEFR